MKKISISFLFIFIIVLSVIGLALPTSTTHTEYLRIHIRANSNEQIDQSVKYEIKDKIVEYLTPYISECDTLNKAENLLVSNLKGIEKVADKHLEIRGFNYSSKADVRTEEFPTRTYDELTLSAGKYRALIVTLGDGKGDNWWCVVYPPLCFVGNGTRYEYKSKILEIINQFKRNYEEEQ